LIEVLVAALITLIISAGVATALISSTDYTSLARGQTNAQGVAEQDQERMKSMTDAQLTALHQTRTVTLGGSNWTVTSTATFLDANGNSSCTSQSTAYFKLTSVVNDTTPSGGTATLASVSTIITRPLAGSLVVPVETQTATPLSGVGVTVVGSTTSYTASATTDANGCVAFAGLPTDTYTITGTDPGYVTPNGATSATESASVTQSGITNANALFLGAAGNVRVGFRTVGSNGEIYDGNTSVAGHGQAPVGYEVSYYGQGSGLQMANPGCVLASGSCTSTGSPPVFTAAGTTNASTVTVGNMFPFYVNSTSQYTNNYQTWAGACAQEQPLQPPSGGGWLTNFGTVLPGQGLPVSGGADVTVDEPAIDVAVKYGSTVYLPAHVDITFTGKNSSGTVTCTDKWNQIPSVGSETVSGTNYATYPAPFASTSAAGSATASENGYPGTITVCADYNGYDGTSSAITNTNFNGATVVPVINATTKATCSP
jgi:Tfp pilus assembly protein PilV